MDIVLTKKNGTKVEITNLVTSMTISGEYRSPVRMLDFSYIQDPALAPFIPIVNLEVGDTITLHENNKVHNRIYFKGTIWDKSKSADVREIDIVCKDEGIRLTKNRGSYKFKNIMPEAIVAKIAKDFGIGIGYLSPTNKKISRNFLGDNLYTIIISAYNLSNTGKYIVRFIDNKLYVLKKGITMSKELKGDYNMLSTSVSESLDGMVNRVSIYNKDDKLIRNIDNANDIKLYGVLSEYLKVTDGKDYMEKANKMLRGLDRKITVTNFGNIDYVTGNAVIVKEANTGLNGKFFIDGDEHNFKNGIYTNKLVLNFENIVDETEGGSDSE